MQQQYYYHKEKWQKETSAPVVQGLDGAIQLLNNWGLIGN